MSDVDDAVSSNDEWLNDVQDDETVTTDENQGDDKPTEDADDTETVDDAAAKDTKQDGADEGDDASDDSNADKPKDGEADDPAKAEADAEAERKRHNDEMARQRIAQREALQSIGQAHINEAQAAAEKELEAAGDDQTKRDIAEMKLREAQREAETFYANAEANQKVIANDADRAIREISIFREKNEDGSVNPEFSPKALEAAMEDLTPHLITKVVTDENGNKQEVILGSKVSVYEFLKNKGELYSEFGAKQRAEGARQGQRDADQMHARSEDSGAGHAPKRAEAAADKEVREMEEAFSN